MKYIDAERLRAKIEKDLTFDNNIDTAFYIGRRDAERSILALIDSLRQEQLEVDLEKELEKYCRIYYNCNYPDQIQNGKCSVVMPHIVEAARHFYELGLKAKEK